MLKIDPILNIWHTFPNELCWLFVKFDEIWWCFVWKTIDLAMFACDFDVWLMDLTQIPWENDSPTRKFEEYSLNFREIRRLFSKIRRKIREKPTKFGPFPNMFLLELILASRIVRRENSKIRNPPPIHFPLAANKFDLAQYVWLVLCDRWPMPLLSNTKCRCFGLRPKEMVAVSKLPAMLWWWIWPIYLGKMVPTTLNRPFSAVFFFFFSLF